MFIKALYGIVCLAALVSRGLCVPAPTPSEKVSLNTTNDIYIRETPPVPDAEEIKKHLDVAKNICLFYSGPGGYAKKARNWAKGKKNGYKVLVQLWTDSKYPDPWQNNEDTSTKFFNHASQAMAESCSGIVYVMLPSNSNGKDWKAGTVWDEYEWPHMSSAVTEVIRVNPDNDDKETIKGS